ncbi:M56 family metallopeptidase [Shewanella gelidii]|uniref:Peptidase M48 domain-containing protein n=1 Tax=Shewanella gelidii TaxID=1642821 RepID=A0A917JZJ9_9GAMM|nr:M56 family metallopeptidase [Shewanella gelidii]MCL1099385.1 M56 family metallopeptidase [Shewanella gelidii]GGI91376.1 hypothetical protein GCM10009332_30870 [Shewanella gelidii]
MFTLELLYACTASTLILSWLFAGFYPIVRRWLIELPAVLASKLIVLFSILPLVTVTLVLLFYSQPFLNELLVYSHCHDGVCGPHWLHLPVSNMLSSGLLLLVFAVFILFITVITRQIARSRNYWLMMQGLSRLEGENGFRIVESEKLTAWCAGMWKPQVYISRGLLNQLSESQLNMVLAHEHCHANNKDNLRKSVLHWSTLHWPRKLKQRIRTDFTNKIELSCDAAAVIHEQDTTGFKQAIQLITQHCSRADVEKAVKLNERHNLLHDELQKLQLMSQQSFIKSWLLGFMLLVFWFAVILLTSQLLHPMLEFISR